VWHSLWYAHFMQDGNRRYGNKIYGKDGQLKGHSSGRETLAKVLEWCHFLEIKEVSLYALSVDNVNKRPKEELDILYALFKDTFTKAIENESFFMKNKVCVKFLGRISILPIEVQESIAILEKKTESFNSFKLNICMAYSSTEEFLDCVKSMQQKGVATFDYKTFEENLYGLPHPDIVVRTSGEIRLSNYFLYQGRNSMIMFMKCFWPEFSLWDMNLVVRAYQTNRNTLN